MARKIKPLVREFYQWHRWGDRWARLTIEWSEHPELPENWKCAAEAVAEKTFMAAMGEVRRIVDAQWGKIPADQS